MLLDIYMYADRKLNILIHLVQVICGYIIKIYPYNILCNQVCPSSYSHIYANMIMYIYMKSYVKTIIICKPTKLHVLEKFA